LSKLHHYWTSIRLSRDKLQREKALELVRNAKIDIPNEVCSIAESEHFQKYLANKGIITPKKLFSYLKNISLIFIISASKIRRSS